MKRSRTKERDIKGLNSAPKSHRELVTEARGRKISIPEQKYRMKVLLGSGKLFMEMTAHTREKLESGKVNLEERNKDKVLTFGEIEPINK